jgi:hypothetical protein
MSAHARTALLAGILSLLALVGCASDPRYKEGVAWIQWQEAERARLEGQGFPQFSFF